MSNDFDQQPPERSISPRVKLGWSCLLSITLVLIAFGLLDFSSYVLQKLRARDVMRICPVGKTWEKAKRELEIEGFNTADNSQGTHYVYKSSRVPMTLHLIAEALYWLNPSSIENLSRMKDIHEGMGEIISVDVNTSGTIISSRRE